MASAKKGERKYWSGRVTKQSNALDLDRSVFTWKNPKHIARSLKRSVKTSKRRKAESFRSAMSMLNFYINRAGKSLPKKQKNILNRAEEELRRLFGKCQSNN